MQCALVLAAFHLLGICQWCVGQYPRTHYDIISKSLTAHRRSLEHNLYGSSGTTLPQRIFFLCGNAWPTRELRFQDYAVLFANCLTFRLLSRSSRPSEPSPRNLNVTNQSRRLTKMATCQLGCLITVDPHDRACT
ncbi:uncharacterized protein BT62DRAFT_262474 [Guyanagaster necrorhizus]|uniref:Secreted protein n=1 Tax=Guyanagaster necrorhizus TaxID=856835 RepID=A0A9P8AXK8_9AGAR|nr:uncharacterized protein BT62DRAFT_262474 [Guyanagaster necrorhizus MCA 3950]KAG7451713.1 hypothetical protein BT62DRAFT_262474 [Guyanagaster necrorhizus MCA 3950]